MGRGRAGGAAKGKGARASAGGGSVFDRSRAKLQTTRVLHPDEVAGEVAGINAYLGRNARFEDIPSLVGAPHNAVVEARLTATGAIGISITSPQLTARRAIFRNAKGELRIYNEEINVRKKDQGKGLGTKIFARQVHHAAQHGIHHIETVAARDRKSVGYNAWARLGYNAVLPKGVRANLPKGLQGARTLNRLMKTQAGRDWWKSHGESINARFNLRAGSRDRKALDSYLREKGIR